MKYFMVIDIGTGSGRSVLFDTEGKIVASSQQEWLPKSDPRYPGSQDFDTDTARSVISSTIKDVIIKAGISPKDISAVTATSMREGMVLYDADKKIIWACSNVDARADKEVVEMIHEGLAEDIYNEGGDWLNIISPARFRWIQKNEPEVFNKVRYVNMISDWYLFILSGLIVTDPTIGSSSGIFNLKERTWSENIISKANLPNDIYPPVIESGNVIGELTVAAAKETGLAAGTKIVTSGADTQMALVGAGAVTPGTVTVCAGTFWQTTLTTDYALYDPEYRLRTLCHAVPEQWMTEGIGFYHGFAMRWVRDAFCQEEKAAAKKTGESSFTLMERLAEKIPAGSNGVLATFSNIMNSKKWIHSPPALIGFDLLNPEASGKAAVIRAVMEGAAYVTRGHLEILREITNIEYDKVILVGGASNGNLWPQIIADTIGVPVMIPDVKETTAFGSYICCRKALGDYSSWQEATDDAVSWERTIEPNNNNVKVYNQHFEKWKLVYEYMVKLSEDNVLPGLWKAPGV